MRKHRLLTSCGLALGLALAAGGASFAAEPAPSVTALATLHWTEAAPAQAAEAAAAPAADVAVTADHQAATDAALDDLSGRGSDTNVTVALTEQSLSGVTTGNTMNAGTIGSGAITLQDSALSGFGGISNVMMNTGHNNNLQSNMSVTVIITP